MDTVEDINQALAEMGEPPLGPGDAVQTAYVEAGGGDVAELADDNLVDADEKPAIKLLEPPGFKRCSIIFMNGREVILDMQLEDLVVAVDEFLADGARAFLELQKIEGIGANENDPRTVWMQIPIRFSRRALEMLQSMQVVYAKHVPGVASAGGKGKVAVVRGEEAKQVIVQLNRQQRRSLQRNGRG